jgi:outer membrane protein TolC
MAMCNPTIERSGEGAAIAVEIAGWLHRRAVAADSRGRMSSALRVAVLALPALLALLALLGRPGAARADAAEPVDQVSLDQAIAAIAQAPIAPVAGLAIAGADAAVEAAGAWPAPAVRLETNRLTARVVAGLTLPLPVLGTVGAARDEARAHAEVVRADAAIGRRELRRRVVAAWLELARADAQAQVQALAASQAAELEQIARGRLDAGAGSEVDLTAAHAARVRADLAVAAAARELDAASAMFAGELGWDPARPRRAAGALPGGDADLAALLGQLARHPVRTAGLRRIGEGAAAERRIGAERWPGLALEAQASFDDPTQPGTDLLIGVALDLPVFGRIGDRLRAAHAQTEVARAELAATEAQIAGALVAAFRRWEAARDQLAGLERDVLPVQIRAAQLAAQAYREGARDLATAQQAERDLAAVRFEVSAARIAAAQRWVEVQLASGQEPGGH